MKYKRTLFIFMILCASFLMLPSAPLVVMAQSKQQAPQVVNRSNSPAGEPCAAGKTFTFGTGAALFKFCLSDDGNVFDITSPTGFRHIFLSEGYVACGTGAANAFSLGVSEFGWGASTTSQPGGANTLPVTITRQTTDGKFELKQTFTWDTAEKEILITMILKNISAASIANIKLARYFAGVISGDGNDDIFSRDADSVWGKDEGTGGGHHALLLTALTFEQVHTVAVEDINDFSAGGGSETFKKCAPLAQAVPTVPGFYAGRVQYTLGTLAAGASKTVEVLYRRF